MTKSFYFLISVLLTLFFVIGLFAERYLIKKDAGNLFTQAQYDELNLKNQSLEKKNDLFKKELLKIRGHFSEISSVDIEEYLRLKTMEEKYQKAEEILGKILLIFFADLDIHLTQSQREFAEKMSENPLPTIESHEEGLFLNESTPEKKILQNLHLQNL